MRSPARTSPKRTVSSNTLLVSLPWYDLPGSASAVDTFWLSAKRTLKRVGVQHLPAELERQTPLFTQWRSPHLLLSQCCGLDLFAPHAAALKPVARPVFATLDCEAGSYYSLIVTRPGSSPRGVAAVNSVWSRSGYTALLEWLRDEGLGWPRFKVSGSHTESLRLLCAGRADVAAIDAHSWQYLDHCGLEVIGKTRSAPTPPYVTRAGGGAGDTLLAALSEAAAVAGKTVGINGVLPVSRYDFESLRLEAETWGGAVPVSSSQSPA